MDIKDEIFAGWMRDDGPETDVVVSSRIRLARNIDNLAFTHIAGHDDLDKVLRTVEEVIKSTRDLADMKIIDLDSLSVFERELLVARHLISPELAQNWERRAVILSEDNESSIMVNEEDHLRIQSLLPGSQFQKAWEMANRVDDLLEAKLNYAFSEDIGYLTACPTNAGTGLRGSIMLHLPALKRTNQIGAMLNAVLKLGLAIRGTYGEGTEATGDMYQISNQITLGQSEEEILENLSGTARQIIYQERNARSVLLKEYRSKVEDVVYRAYGLLKNARILSSEEALKLISEVRMGIYTDIIKGISASVINELMVIISPAYVSKVEDRELSSYERDVKRAELVREKLSSISIL